MYGLLLEACCHHITDAYGEEAWNQVRLKSGTSFPTFNTHEIYPENTMLDLAYAGSDILGVTHFQMMERFGVNFVDFVCKFGYDSILKVLGRSMRDFLNSLDNIHEHLRHSYSQMQAPSFFCTNETRYGLTLHYRSKRKGYVHYVMGQIQQVGRRFYETDVEIEIVMEKEMASHVHVVMQLYFDNVGFKELKPSNTVSEFHNKVIPQQVFFRVFPFHLLFDRNLQLRSLGEGVHSLLPDLTLSRVDHLFDMSRPPVDFTFEDILAHTNTAFELVSTIPLSHRSISANEDMDSDLRLRLKGQMKFLPQWDCFLFIATPIVDSLENMYDLGLYVSDLAMYDVGRQMVMLGTEHSKELQGALRQARQKSRKLEEIIRLLDAERKRTNSLVYQMIPREVAEALRVGQPAVTTCQTMDSVTILFSQVVGFTDICISLTPMEVVSLLNLIYTNFDKLTEINRVYKVETTGDAYMVVGGAPSASPHHALMACDMALDMITCTRGGATAESNITIKIGVHTGPVVAGVVGIKMPRYCLFGDTVNTASRMESNSKPMRIHVSEVTKKRLDGFPYLLEERGSIDVKGKGAMKTFWLLAREGRPCVPTPRLDPITPAYSIASYSPSSHLPFHNPASAACTTPYTPVTFDQLHGELSHSPPDSQEKGLDSELTSKTAQGKRKTTPGICSSHMCVVL